LRSVVFRTCMSQTIELSKKSYLGKNSTLLKTGPGTNLIYEIILPEGVNIDCDDFNRKTFSEKGRIKLRLETLVNNYGARIEFRKAQSYRFFLYLRVMDGEMTQLLGNLLLIKYIKGYDDLKRCTEELASKDPFDYDIATYGNVYEHKVKRFLQSCAQGLTIEKLCLDIYDATEDPIIVEYDGDIVCYSIYQLDKLRNFLFNNTKFVTASTGEDKEHPGHPRPDSKQKFFYGWLYKEDGHYYIKINLQIKIK